MVRRFRTIKDSKPCNRTVLSVSACVAAPPRRDLLPAATESPSAGAMPSLLLSEPRPTEEMKSKNFKKRKVDEDEEESDTTSDSTVAKRPKLMEEGVEADDPNALSNFRISNALREALELKGIKALFPIQAMTFDLILDGFDLVGRARTGQGKTLAFVLPILESLTNGILKGSRKTGYGRSPSVLVLLPTRELAKQVHSDFEVYGEAVGLSSCCLYGGSPFRAQVMSIKEGVDIVVGTPGRVKDHIQRNTLDLKTLNFRVLDEADEMLKMGFVNDVEQILRKVEDARKVQTLLFSATLPDWVKKISARFLKKDKKTADLIGNQKLKASANVRHLVLPCSPSVRQKLIPHIIDFYSSGGRTIIFTETKRSADKLGGILPGAQALHGDIMQQQREVILAGFRSGKFLVLVATNVAARGLDISDVQLIIQCEPPRDVEDYIHRSGRTGRAGNTGIAILLYEPKNKSRVSRIEKDSGVKFEHISAPESAGIDESAESLAATAITNVNRFSRGRDGKRFSNGGGRGGSREDGRGGRGRGGRGRGRGRGGNRGGSREGGRGGGRGRGRAGSGGNRFNRR